MRRGTPWSAMRPQPRSQLTRGSSGASADELTDEVDDEAGEAADDRAVDADELEVAADLQLDAARRLGRIPAGDGRRDQLAHLLARLLDEARRRPTRSTRRPSSGATGRRAGGRRRRRRPASIRCRSSDDGSDGPGQQRLLEVGPHRARPLPHATGGRAGPPSAPRPGPASRARRRGRRPAAASAGRSGPAARGRDRRPRPRGGAAPRRRAARTRGRRRCRAPTTATRSRAASRSVSRLASSDSATRRRMVERSCWCRPSAMARSRPLPRIGPGRRARGPCGPAACSMASCTSSSWSASIMAVRTVAAWSPTRRALAGSASHAPSRAAIGGAPQLLGDDVGGEEVALDEGAEAPADVVLAVRDDRGVGDRDAERVPEQRGHREPVGQRTDHGRLGRGPHVGEPRDVVLERAGDEEDDGRADQQAGGDPLHVGQVALAPQLVLVGQRRRRSSRPSIYPGTVRAVVQRVARARVVRGRRGGRGDRPRAVRAGGRHPRRRRGRGPQAGRQGLGPARLRRRRRA